MKTNEVVRKAITDYYEERENKNFISGLNFCVDLPIQCNCGIEKTLPQKSKEEGATVRISYFRYLLCY